MSTTPRHLGVGLALAVGLAAGLLAGTGLAQPGHAAAITPSVSPDVRSGSPGVFTVASGTIPGAGATGVAAVTGSATGAETGGTGASTTTTPAIAYPYFGGSPGVAPDHTIVVTGTGRAALVASGSNRAGAQGDAIAAAMADAKAQASAVAAAAGLSITGVLSVSASVSPVYGIVPMAAPATGSSSGQTMSPAAPAPVPSYPATLDASVTVAYRVG